MRTIIISVLMMTCAMSYGQTTSSVQTKLTREQCIQLAEDNSYRMKVGKAEIEKSKIQQGTAWDIEKTELSLGQDPTSGGSPDNALSLSQRIDFPTTYIARRNTLKAETNVATRQWEMARKQLISEVSKTYEQLVYAQERIRILESLDSILHRDVSLATKRYKAGESRQLELLAAQRLLDDNKMEATVLQAEFHTAQQQLMALLNTTERIAPATDNQQILAYTPLAHTPYNQTAEGQLYTTQLDREERKIKEAKTGYLPGLNIGLRHQLVLSGWNPYQVDRSKFDGGNFMGFEVGMGIPLFFGATKAKVRAAKKDKEIVTLQRQQAMQQQQVTRETLTNQYLAARSRIDYYEKTGNPRAEEVSRIAQLCYENGEIGYVEYFNALKEAIDTRRKYAEAVYQHNQSVIDLQYLNR